MWWFLGHRQLQKQCTSQSHGSTQLFDDMSGYNNEPNMIQHPNSTHEQHEAFPGQPFLQDPMANMAVQYGSKFVPAGKEFVEKKVYYYSQIQIPLFDHALFLIKS